MAAIHAGYVQTIVQANGQALAQDAAIQAGNAFQYNGNSYAVDEVSLLILRDVPMVHIGQFDPHADPAGATRPARSAEIDALDLAARTQDPAVSVDTANLNAIAVLPGNQAACAKCHAEGSLPPLGLVYQFRELADD